MDIKDTLYEHCRSHGMTKSQLASKLGISRQFLYQIMDDNVPCPKRVMRKLAKILGMKREILGIFFGQYPLEWIRMSKDKPRLTYEYIDDILKSEGYRNANKK